MKKIIFSVCFAMASLYANATVFDELASHFLVHEYPGMEKVRLGNANNGGYVADVSALESSDVVLAYGYNNAYHDNSFEVAFSQLYNKQSYGLYNASLRNNTSLIRPDSLFTFSSKDNGFNVGLFNNVLSNNTLKKYIKMDIEGEEYNVLNAVLVRKNFITGIVLEIHGVHQAHTVKVQLLPLLEKIEQNFLLTHIHGNNHCRENIPFSPTAKVIGNVPGVLKLTFINKNLVSNSSVSENQSHPTGIDVPDCSNLSDAAFIVIP